VFGMVDRLRFDWAVMVLGDDGCVDFLCLNVDFTILPLFMCVLWLG
jgi:hypothetical protein